MLIWGPPGTLWFGAPGKFWFGAPQLPSTLWFEAPSFEGVGKEQKCNNKQSKPTPAALAIDKNLFFQGLLHNPLLIMIYTKYDIAYNILILVIFHTFFHSYYSIFFFLNKWGAPLQVGALGTCL